MRKASTRLLEQGIQAPSPAPDLIPAETKTSTENLHWDWYSKRGHFTMAISRPTIRRIVRWSIYTLAFLVFVTIGIATWGHFHPDSAPRLVHTAQGILIAYFTIQLLIGGIILAYTTLATPFQMVRNSENWKGVDKYVNYVAVIIMLATAFQIVPVLVQIPGAIIHHHMVEFSFARLVRVYLVAALLILGTCIYAFKRWNKAVFGISEIVIALLSNSALLNHINLSHFPDNISSVDALAIGVFTYLLSKGVGDVLEGMEEKEEEKKTPSKSNGLQPSPAPPPA